MSRSTRSMESNHRQVDLVRLAPPQASELPVRLKGSRENGDQDNHCRRHPVPPGSVCRPAGNRSANIPDGTEILITNAQSGEQFDFVGDPRMMACPNILIFLADNQRRDTLGFRNDTPCRTPQLEVHLLPGRSAGALRPGEGPPGNAGPGRGAWSRTRYRRTAPGTARLDEGKQ